MATKAQLEAMSIDELEAHRNDIAGQQAKLQVEFRAAGVAKAKKIASSPRVQGKAMIAEGRAIIAEAAAEAAAEDLGD